MTRPKLIILYGFAGIGKTTIAKRYVNEHALAMNLDQDRLIDMLGLWPQHEKKARELVHDLCKTLAVAYLKLEHDIIIPCLPARIDHIQEFESIAKKADAQFYEIALTADREDAIQRLLKRGMWGEESLPALKKQDLPLIEKLYDDTSKTLQDRPKAIRIPSTKNDPEGTYRQFLKVIEYPARLKLK